MSNDVPTEGPCVGICGRTLDEEFFCFGCKAFICDDCALNDITGFDHSPLDHRLGSACCDTRIMDGVCEACGGEDV